MKNKFNFSLEPGKELKIIEYIKKEPVIAIIMPFYNDGKYISQSVNCVLNQTYPYFELIIVDDGSKDKDSLKKLEEIAKLDTRIRVFHKENEGPAVARDFGATKISNSVKYLVFFDSDDLIEKTFLETLYLTLETNKDAAWAYPDSVGFEGLEYTWNYYFDSERLKKVNDLIALAMIRKEVFFEVNGYELKEKSVHEDWNFWLKLIAKGYYPVHVSYYAMWYRRKRNSGELAKAKQNKKRALEIIKNTVKTIKKEVSGIEYPLYNYNYEVIPDNFDNILVPKKKNNDKINILMIFPWMVTGGADNFNKELVTRLDKEKFSITIITTLPSTNNLREYFEPYANIYDLTSFLDQKYWLAFLNYIIEKENINLIFNTNSMQGYTMLPYLKAKYPHIPILDYVHMEEWYYRNGGFARTSFVYKDVIDKTLVCNKGTKNVLSKHFGKSEDEVETVYIGVDTNKFDTTKFNKEEILKKYQLENNDKIIIGFICRIENQKRPMLLLEIMKKTLEKRRDILFLIVGDGSFLPILKREIKELKLTENVKFLGNLSDTAEIYKICDLTLNCSIKEGLALTSYESLAMGVPVISADVGGQGELINDEVGRIVPCLQKEEEINNFNYSKEEVDNYILAIEELTKDLKKYQNNCRKRILNGFSLDNMVSRMTEIFISEINKPNEDKINKAQSLANYDNLLKELYLTEIINYRQDYIYLIKKYQQEVYANIFIDDNGLVYSNKYTRLSRFKDFLWKNALWRVFVKTSFWKFWKKTYYKIRKRK